MACQIVAPEIWDGMAPAAAFIQLAGLEEATQQLPHFAPLEDQG